MMLRLLTVAFDTQIEPWELPAFRGAMAVKSGLEHDLFHNHDHETGGYHYRLPLIQYKQERGRPMLVCLNEGIEELHHFFSKPDWTLLLNGRAAPVRIARLDVKQFQLTVSEETYRYHIRQWIALKDDNYEVYRSARGAVEQLSLLEKILQNQLVGLFYQLNATLECPLKTTLLRLTDERWVSYKGIKMLAFSLEFEANVNLPDYMGLGKGCSVGWGVVKGLKG